MRIFYYLVIRPLSLLPSWFLYLLSDWLLFPLLYYVLAYRKKLVTHNLTSAFPNKSTLEIARIAKRFYQHFADLIVESIMIFDLSEESVIDRGRVTNPELLKRYYDQGRSVCLVGGHFNNWEMLTVSIGAQISHQADGIYTRLQNPWMDKKVNRSRSRLGMRLVHKKKVAEHFEKTVGELTATIFAVDQSPRKSQLAYWLTFLGQETAVAFGAEKYARQYNWVVLYGHIKKVRRGHYTLTFELLCDEPGSEPIGQITEKHTKVLEEEIRKNPECWLWTHNRWKLIRET